MSNLEMDPVVEDCVPGPPVAVEVITAREVPLGGPRAMPVRRTLPQRQRSLIGAWCFIDHYGPDDVSATGGMDVAPHPHTGLATVSWLFSGEIEHRDAAGVHAMVRPGELNLMSAGAGICHSEVSTPETTVLHGAQLWLALPESARDGARDFHHHAPEAVAVDGGSLRVFLGSLAGSSSPVPTATPLLGAELVLDPGATVVLDVDPAFEHGVLVDSGPSPSRARRWRGPSSATWVSVRVASPSRTPPTNPAASCSWVGSRSARRSSCGGTSSGARTTRSPRTARSGRRPPSASAPSRATWGPGHGFPRRRCRPRRCGPA
jgi:redox-sensitive bicupin YhaK (pirin superfamily)